MDASGKIIWCGMRCGAATPCCSQLRAIICCGHARASRDARLCQRAQRRMLALHNRPLPRLANPCRARHNEIQTANVKALGDMEEVRPIRRRIATPTRAACECGLLTARPAGDSCSWQQPTSDLMPPLRRHVALAGRRRAPAAGGQGPWQQRPVPAVAGALAQRSLRDGALGEAPALCCRPPRAMQCAHACRHRLPLLLADTCWWLTQGA